MFEVFYFSSVMVLISSSVNFVFRLELSVYIILCLRMQGVLSDGRRDQIKDMFPMHVVVVFCTLWGTFQGSLEQLSRDVMDKRGPRGGNEHAMRIYHYFSHQKITCPEMSNASSFLQTQVYCGLEFQIRLITSFLCKSSCRTIKTSFQNQPEWEFQSRKQFHPFLTWLTQDKLSLQLMAYVCHGTITTHNDDFHQTCLYHFQFIAHQVNQYIGTMLFNVQVCCCYYHKTSIVISQLGK